MRKLRFENLGNIRKCRIFIDDLDITNITQSIEISMSVRHPLPVVRLGLILLDPLTKEKGEALLSLFDTESTEPLVEPEVVDIEIE